jgi:acetylornithine deacetylase/succinyl-diaminopimelate desuccinylase-like protein
MKDVIGAIEANQAKLLETLGAFLRIPSVSADPPRAGEVKRAARFLADHFVAIGLENVRVHETKRHPIVYADWLHAPGKPTVLCYGHYDVQPEDPIELWETPPYEPTIKGRKLYARGSTDDKGQIFCHVGAIDAFFRTRGKLPVNVKFVIEGEEEIASENLDVFVAEQKKLLACDVVLVSDTSMPGKGMPAITYGLRGLVYMQIDLVGANTDLHSGTYGGAVQNPAVALASIITTMKDKNGRVLIQGFYDDVVRLDARERAELAKVPHNERTYMKELGIPATFGEKGYTTTERATARPTLDVNGIWGGYQGEGSKTVLPAKAGAKVSMRLVPNQKPKKIAALFAKHVKKVCPAGVKCTVRTFSGGMPFLTPLTEPTLKKAAVALEKGFGASPVFMREGGSIPVVSTLSTALRAPVLLLGFGLHTEKAHAPNEHFDLDNFRDGARSIAYLLDELAK